MTGHHDHGHSIGAASRADRNRLWFAFSMTLVIVLSQIVGAALTGSLALLVETAHAVVDASGLLIAVISAQLMLRPPDTRRTWGFRRAEVIAALGQAGLLLGVGSWAFIDGIGRLISARSIVPEGMLVFGIIGLVANAISILVMSSGRESSLNMRAAFLEVLTDAFGAGGVIVAAIVIQTTGFQQADVIAGLLIAGFMIPRALRILRESLQILMEQTPRGVDLEEVRTHIHELGPVIDVHDIHASTIGTGLPILTAHVVVSDECFSSADAPGVLDQIQTCVRTHFPVSFQHVTMQLETEAQRDAEALPH